MSLYVFSLQVFSGRSAMQAWVSCWTAAPWTACWTPMPPPLASLAGVTSAIPGSTLPAAQPCIAPHELAGVFTSVHCTTCIVPGILELLSLRVTLRHVCSVLSRGL